MPWATANIRVNLDTISLAISTNQTNVNVAALFGSYWKDNIAKTLTINSGVVIGSPLTSNYALYINPNLGGSFTLINYGSIQGAGGAANSGTGGPAIYAGSAVTINNQGSIYGGGGGGGLGGTGGGGVYSYYYECNCHQCVECFNEGTDAYYCNYFECCDTCTGTTPTTGGAGGAGGRGQGYAQNNTSGVGGAGGSGPGAGTGGTGGTGGTFGNSGDPGNTGANGTATNPPTLGQAGGPAYGGLAGYYIVGNGNVTWSATGTRGGRVG